MNTAQQIISALHENGVAEVSGFGTFAVVTRHAEMDPANGRMLPPGRDISFQQDFSGSAGAEVQHWQDQLLSTGHLRVEGLGVFNNDDGKIEFISEIQNLKAEEFFGLEEINLDTVPQGIKEMETAAEGKDYKFSRTLLWVILIAIPLAALAYLGIARPESLFGKKSFNQVPIQPVPVKPAIDSAKIAREKAAAFTADSLRTDSLRKDSLLKAAPAKKWPSKNNRKKTWQR